MTNTLTLAGNITGDPELRFTQSGLAVAAFTVAYTPRKYDKAAGEWKDGETLFMRCSVWREAAENVAESLVRGSRVIVTGQVQQRKYTAKDGSERISVEMDVDEVGPSLRYATAKPVKRPKGSGGGATVSAPSDPWGGGSEPPF